VQVEIGAMAYIFNAGHRVRVAVQGSNAPRFSVNLNNGSPVADNTTTPVIAHTTLLLGGAAASTLTLPVTVPTTAWRGWPEGALA